MSDTNEQVPVGTTAIPTGSHRIEFDDSRLSAGRFQQQPQTQAIAVYEASKDEKLDPLVHLNGNLIDVNHQFVVYTVKNGLIRVMHRNSAMRALLRGHHNQTVTDLSFFHDGDVLGTVGHSSEHSTLIVWRVYERSPEIGSERLLEISTSVAAPDLTLSRLIWHPFNPNQFWMTHSTKGQKQVATLVETTRIQTKLVDTPLDPKAKQQQQQQQQQQHAVCQWHSPYCVMEDALQLRVPQPDGSDAQLVDLCWSGRDARHVLSVHKDGSIVLWDLKGKNGEEEEDDDDDAARGAGDSNDKGAADSAASGDSSVVPRKLASLHETGVEHSRCLFLPHEQSLDQFQQTTTTTTTTTTSKDGSTTSVLTTCFATASGTNSTVTIWSAFALQTKGYGPPMPVLPTKLQEISLAATKPSSFVMDVSYGPADLSPTNGAPPSCFLVLGSRDTGALYALHVQAEWSSSDSGGGSSHPLPKSPLCVGVDYLVPFSLKHPVYSWSVVCGPTEDGAGGENDDDKEAAGASSSTASGPGFDMKAFAYQSKAVQCLTMTSTMALPPSAQVSSSDGFFRVQSLRGPYVASTVAAPDLADSSLAEPEYDEEDYDIDDVDVDEDDDGDGGHASPVPPSIPTVPTATTSGLFPGAPNPFANWLGAIAGGSAPSADNTVDDKDLPTPPAPSDLPMPPGIVAPASGSATNGNSDSAGEEFLNPLELLAKSMSGESIADNKAVTKPNKSSSHSHSNSNNSKIISSTRKSNKSRSKSPRRNNNKSPRGSRSSRSPKRAQSNKKGNGQKSSSGNNSKSPFPDGKVTILKRDPDSAVSPSVPLPTMPATASSSPPPLPADPSVLSDPALMAAAGIPIPGVSTVSIDPQLVRQQVQTAVDDAVSNLVVPTINKAVKESFSSMAKPLHNSMESLSSKGVSVDIDDLKDALDIETPLNAAIADSLRTVLVPALESITGRVLEEVKASMPKLPPPPPPTPDNSKALSALAQQMVVMTSKMDALMTEVQGLRKTVLDQAAAAAAQAQASATSSPASVAAGPSDPNSALLQTRNEIDALLSKGKFEEAFTKAVATTTPQMAVYCSARSSLETVLRGPTPALSQPILICLMQQLSAALAGTQSAQELKIELAWLQEIALTMNPSDPSIAQHVPKVVGQLVSNVNARMASEGNSPFRRPLQMLLQSLRGMQLG